MSINISGNHYYSQIASGTRIQKASDDPAGLAITNKQQSQANGYDTATRNIKDGQSALQVADGAYESITNSLQRMRELAVQASNSILTDSDKKMIQQEVEQLKQGISDIGANTQFNTKNLLDGSHSSMYIQSGSNSGQGQNINTGSAALQALGIADFDVTKNFDIQDIDNALSVVSSNRSTIGAQSNTLDAAAAYSRQASYHLTSSISRRADTDIGEAVGSLKKEQLLETVNVIMQKKQMEQKQAHMQLLF